jgi:hypothetical protein
MCIRIAGAGGVDRLFDHSHPAADHLDDLAEVERRLAAHQRWRRLLVAGAALLSLLCWLYARFGLRALSHTPPLFAFFAGVSASVYLWERRLRAERRRLRHFLPITQPPFGPGLSAIAAEVGYTLRHTCFMRRLILGGMAVLGVAPFLDALAPAFAPSLIAMIEVVWKTLACILVPVTIDELCLRRAWRRVAAQS